MAPLRSQIECKSKKVTEYGPFQKKWFLEAFFPHRDALASFCRMIVIAAQCVLFRVTAKQRRIGRGCQFGMGAKDSTKQTLLFSPRTVDPYFRWALKGERLRKKDEDFQKSEWNSTNHFLSIEWEVICLTSSSAPYISRRIKRPSPRKYLEKGDWGHSLKGMVAGLFVLGLCIINLGLFFGLDGRHANKVRMNSSQIKIWIVFFLCYKLFK